MTILVYTKYNSSNIKDSIGLSEYSYYFVLQKFLPILQEVGQVIEVEDPQHEVDVIYEKAKQKGEQCIFLSFTAPHNTSLGLKCPCLPVFAWEYDSIPNESWDGNENNNWVDVLKKLGAAITHSNHSLEVVQNEMGQDFPILACPAPIDRLDSKQETFQKAPKSFKFRLSKEVIDSKYVEFGKLSAKKDMATRIHITHVLLQTWAHEVLEDVLPKMVYRAIRQIYIFIGTTVARTLRFFKKAFQTKKSKSKTEMVAMEDSMPREEVSGVIYTSILNIMDKRKNYVDMVAAFCHALKDKPDACLILKTPVINDLYFYKEKVLSFLEKLSSFKCRVIFIGYYLDQEEYNNLKNASSYYVNTSYGEGQCLPLMEYMAVGIPAIAPQSSALADYIEESNAFVLKTNAVPTAWQHDERMAIRSVHHRPDWYALISAYEESYRIIKEDTDAYANKKRSAQATLQKHCSPSIAKEKLVDFLNQQIQNQ